MTGRPGLGKARARGNIETLRSGALRVRVYAGVDPVTKKRHNLIEVIPPGPKAWRTAEKARDRLLHEVAERRNPRTSATVDQLLTRYLDQFDGAPNTLTLYRGYVSKHIHPLLGALKVGEVDADVLDSFYAELRRCRDHCSGRRTFQHRTAASHECDKRCRPHACRALGPTTIRHMHFLLSGAFERAVRWRWVGLNPVRQASPPAAPKPNPQPPSPAEAARIVAESWSDRDWGALVWTAMTTGARRGEMCAVRRTSLSLDEGRETVWLRKAIRKEHGDLVEAELKTHQQRRVALDPTTVIVLREHLARCDARAHELGFELAADAFVFSGSPDGSTFLRPDGVTQRYDRLAERLGIETTFHKLRHYSATELITGGVDPRTVAGRLGHGGGGTTTLRTYTAWVSEADQRAARGLGAGMPQRPAEIDDAERAQTAPRHPYEAVAADLFQQITEGALAPGSFAPTAAELAKTHTVSLSTAKRALVLARDWGLVTRVGPNRLRVARSPLRAISSSSATPRTVEVDQTGRAVLLDLVVRHRDTIVARFTSVADPRSAVELQHVLEDAVRRRENEGCPLAEYEMDVHLAGEAESMMTFVAPRRFPAGQFDSSGARAWSPR